MWDAVCRTANSPTGQTACAISYFSIPRGPFSGAKVAEPAARNLLPGVVGPTTPFRETLTVYGRILARQSGAVVGNYTARITAVLNY